MEYEARFIWYGGRNGYTQTHIHQKSSLHIFLHVLVIDCDSSSQKSINQNTFDSDFSLISSYYCWAENELEYDFYIDRLHLRLNKELISS